jgi:hypothetical protein
VRAEYETVDAMTADDDPNPPPPPGRRIIWVADWLAVEGAPPELPGVIIDELPDGWALVSWVDADGWYSPEAVYETKNLHEVSDADFEDHVRRGRGTNWAGVPRDG